MSNNIIKIQAIKTPDGYYIGSEDLHLDGRSSPYYWPHRINGGMELKESHLKNWWFCTDKPETLEIKKADKENLVRYALIDKTLAGDSIPISFTPEQVHSEEKCCDGLPEWNEQYKHLRSLYSPTYETIVGEWELVPFELTILGEFDSMQHIGSWSFPTTLDHVGWDRTPVQRYITHEDVNYYIDTKVSAPEILWGSRPCFLSTQQTYDIIRGHVKRNINPKFARVSSDYDFHFAVEKIIKLAKTEEYTVDVNWATKRKPKYQKRFRTERKQVVLDIQPKADSRWGGVVVGRFAGKDLAHLKETIDTVLESIMAEINEPLVDCDKCLGTGCKLDSFESNTIVEHLGEKPHDLSEGYNLISDYSGAINLASDIIGYLPGFPDKPLRVSTCTFPNYGMGSFGHKVGEMIETWIFHPKPFHSKQIFHKTREKAVRGHAHIVANLKEIYGEVLNETK